MCWKCPLFIASYKTVFLLLSLISEVQQRSAELPNALLDTSQFLYAFKWCLIFLFSSLNLIWGLCICFNLFVVSSCGTFPLPSGSFPSGRLNASRRNTSSQLDDPLHAVFSSRSGWKATVWSCSVCVFAHVLVHTHTHTQEFSWISSSGQ